MRSASSSLARRTQRHRAITCGRQRGSDGTRLAQAGTLGLPAAHTSKCRTPGPRQARGLQRACLSSAAPLLSPAVLGLALAHLPAVLPLRVCCHRCSDIPYIPPNPRSRPLYTLWLCFCICNDLPRRLCCLCVPIVRPLACLCPPRWFLRQVPHRPTLPDCPPC
ncbi:hypothetical protein PMIN01_00637 [Paraphaeosphaeria minitans]|uniref:Uncharacterized protein n=1 Tax=Paraphaeosphaeria minitans TaxID=565426 RepID=A0A9P6KVL6_9PLEO|nr:hypothetical protein PMIN01_00637 [Paraphaeosphaeria minitans]